MDYLPVFLKIEDRSCLVVGGGKVAARKVSLLNRAGARITVVAPEICNEVKALVEQGAVTCVEREFREGDMEDAILVIAATDNAAVNRTVSGLAHQLRVPVNVVDNPGLCSFIMPSIIDRSPVQVAVSTGGT
jgi:uroporphyrin-III C-methyltransferase/precorrin-2 dehydrogenase/sirohydrochlorin ferrochelatase